jgi:hypothetical protein
MTLKARIRTLFPALVSVTSPLTLTKTGLLYQFGVDPTKGAVGPSGAGYGGTSTTSLAIGTGSTTFATQSGYAYQAGNYIRASSAADGTNYMEGTITSYGGTSLVLNVTKTGGSGTKTDWTFSLAGTPGANGAGSGDMLAANNLSDVGNKKTSKDNLSVHGADIASAATTNLETSTGDLVDVTGTTTITAITLNEGHERSVRFTGALTLTNGASLVLPGGANITTAAGDFAVFRGYAAGVVRCVDYSPAARTGSGSLVLGTSPTIATPNITGIIPTTATVTISNASPGVITWAAHALPVNTPVFIETSGSLPTGLTAAVLAVGATSAHTYSANPTLYYVKTVLDANTFTVSATPGGTAINTSSAGSGTHTAFANAMVPAGSVGEYIYKVVELGSPFALTTGSAGQVWNTISLTAGIWLLGGNTGVIKTGGTTPTYTHMHSGIVYGFSTIPSSPYNGVAAMHVTSNSENGWEIANDPEVIFLTTTTTINAVVTADFTGGTCGAYGKTWARRVG